MDMNNYIDVLCTYKYLLKIYKILCDKNNKEILFESMINIYRETILSSIDTIMLDIFLIEDKIKTEEPNDISAYSILAIEHYLKFIEVNKYPDVKYKQFGKIILKALKILSGSTYELPEWVYLK